MVDQSNHMIKKGVMKVYVYQVSIIGFRLGVRFGYFVIVNCYPHDVVISVITVNQKLHIW